MNHASAALLQKRMNRAANDVGLVTSRNDYRDRARIAVKAAAFAPRRCIHPKAAMGQQEIEPQNNANASGDRADKCMKSQTTS